MEWNNSAIAVILFLFLVVVAIVYWLLLLILRAWKSYQQWLPEAKKHKVLYFIHYIGLFILSVILSVFLLLLITFVRGKGLLE